ncbi:MAG: hypothetical protein FD187_1677 [bacterium]|jgi:hypothetical protein|nr:MAG: hypothetical protein FD142_2043 [bacterium]KAF0148882.1 MAG: hypothetical protein FD187_1677 [bacterium]KAF0168283.1 MAG: hypothetical protein FD158_1514 [bacterium]TXT20312.1 MAG: hypothetical protein FD132_1355 [bacterium]
MVGKNPRDFSTYPPCNPRKSDSKPALPVALPPFPPVRSPP